MTPAWYQRMNPRERVLSWIVAGTIAVLLNLWILSSLWSAVASAPTTTAAHLNAVSRCAGVARGRRMLP